MVHMRDASESDLGSKRRASQYNLRSAFLIIGASSFALASLQGGFWYTTPLVMVVALTAAFGLSIAKGAVVGFVAGTAVVGPMLAVTPLKTASVVDVPSAWNVVSSWLIAASYVAWIGAIGQLFGTRRVVAAIIMTVLLTWCFFVVAVNSLEMPPVRFGDDQVFQISSIGEGFVFVAGMASGIVIAYWLVGTVWKRRRDNE